jgi:Skp family chaperone for outer membrane proteins
MTHSKQSRRLTVLTAAIFAGLWMARPAMAAPGDASSASGSPSIAIASVQKILESIHEFADIKSQLDLDSKALLDTDNTKQNDVNALQQSLTYLKADSAGYAEQQDKLLKAKIEYDAWRQEARLDLERKEKTEMSQVFSEIEDAISQVAQKDGISLVLDDSRPKIPDNLEGITPEQLRAMISQRTILYSDQSRDISGEIITLLDKNYAAKTAAPH